MCANDPRGEPYVAGIAATSTNGAIQVRYEDADPAPPAVGYNTWTIQVLDASGAPVNDATITVSGWMPDHGHGTSTYPAVTAQGNGTYLVTPMVLFMPGIWQITFAVTTSAGVTGSPVFTFCVND